jgi:tetratricopeptide (TPR) repeat protein
MLEQLAGQEVSPSVAQALHDQTEGNPLFVREIVQDLIEEGVVTRVGDRWRTAPNGPLAAKLPEGLRDVIGKRLSRLSADCNEVLAVGSVIGREFALSTMRETVDLSEKQFFAALEEAQRARVIEDISSSADVTFRFSHALFRQTLYEELFAPRRLLLHQRVARALEARYTKDANEHAAELAEHFAQSTDQADLAKALHYSRVAANRATLVSAHGEAERHFRSALQVLRILEPDNKVAQCDLLLARGQSIVFAGETAELVAIRLASEALAIADEVRDQNRAFEACYMGVKSLAAFGGIAAEDIPEYRVWAEGMLRYAADGTAQRVHAASFLANALAATGHESRARELRLEALALTRRLADSPRRGGEPRQLWNHMHHLVDGWSQPPHRQVERLELVDEYSAFLPSALELEQAPVLAGTGPGLEGIAALNVNLNRIGGLNVGLANLGDVSLTFGQRTRAEETWSQLSHANRRPLMHSWAVLFLHRVQMILGCLDGNLVRIREEAAGMRRDAEALGGSMLARATTSAFMRRALLNAGHVDEALEGFPEGLRNPVADDLPMFGLQGIFAAQRAVCLAHAGRFAEANAIVDHFLNDRPIGDPPDETPLAVVIALLEAGVLSGHKLAVKQLVAHLVVASNLVAVANSLTVIARHLSAAMVLLGDRGRALAYAEQALAVAEKVRFRPEAALARLQLAELQPDNAPCLARAVSELRELDMRPGLTRALDLLRHRQAV